MELRYFVEAIVTSDRYHKFQQHCQIWFYYIWVTLFMKFLQFCRNLDSLSLLYDYPEAAVVEGGNGNHLWMILKIPTKRSLNASGAGAASEKFMMKIAIVAMKKIALTEYMVNDDVRLKLFIYI